MRNASPADTDDATAGIEIQEQTINSMKFRKGVCRDRLVVGSDDAPLR